MKCTSMIESTLQNAYTLLERAAACIIASIDCLLGDFNIDNKLLQNSHFILICTV